jgi:hypothetical protein
MQAVSGYEMLVGVKQLTDDGHMKIMILQIFVVEG